MSGHSVTEWLGQLELGAIGTLEAVLGGVELEAAGEGKSHGHLRAGDEAVSCGVGIVTAWKEIFRSGFKGRCVWS